MSEREVQRSHHVGWRTVKDALGSAWPSQRADYPKRPSKLDQFKEVIDAMLVGDLDAPRKQRHTATRIFARLIDEHGMHDVSYPVVRTYVAIRGPQIRVEQGRGDQTGFVPQTHHPGREAEVDFGEIAVVLRGELVAAHLFSLRMSYSGKAVHRVSATGGQEASFEGHVHAFTELGGVLAGKVRCDNLKAALAQVIGFSRQRVEADRWASPTPEPNSKALPPPSEVNIHDHHTPSGHPGAVRIRHQLTSGFTPIATNEPGRVDRVTRLLFSVRWKLGALFGWEGPQQGVGGRVGSLRERLPADLRETPGPKDPNIPFTPVYVLPNESAQELANKTVHDTLHLDWVPSSNGEYELRMAALVKPNGLFGRLYLAAIKPIRYVLVYPAMTRRWERAWLNRPGASSR